MNVASIWIVRDVFQIGRSNPCRVALLGWFGAALISLPAFAGQSSDRHAAHAERAPVAASATAAHRRDGRNARRLRSPVAPIEAPTTHDQGCVKRQITGSMIARCDSSSLPVTVIQAEPMRQQGVTSAAGMLSQLPGNQ